ncbi:MULTISPECIES: hypothetical protein [unclassified Neptuniibacter]|uniref:hypothetical protein n=1 Tax=unclassified Neptuniibacter TaxID=2630693 RepID=UPI0025D9FD0D|nr:MULTISPECIES: hypothetical protein [unclassified Neptuniibacter]|tara:strand:- start:1113 stop:4601 length:3489 start_codon:yes stop_codon:yes gene_type:complete
MSSTNGKTAACEKDRLHIEVTGINHGDEHTIRFFDTLDQTAKPGIEATKQTLVQEETTIYDWDWTGEISNNAWLEVKTEQGDPIKLPLFKSVYETKRKDNQEQDYLLHACLPSLYMQSVDAQYKYDHIAPARGGFIYIAYKAPHGSKFQVWREIEVIPGDEYTFRDVNLQSFRETPVNHMEWADSLKSNPIKIGQRDTTGVPLTEIWIPGKRNGSKLDGSVLIAFSEVQWTAERINYLEQNQDQLKLRMKRSKISKVSNLQEMRNRSPDLEMLVSDAVELTRDVKGTFLKERYDVVKKEQKLLADDTEYVSTAFGDLRCKADYALRATACAIANDKEPLFPEDIWTSEPEKDCWAKAKQNHLRTFTAEDPLFKVRNHSHLIQSASAYFQQIKQLCEDKDHFLSAELISRLILAESHNGKRNELRKYSKYMDLSSNGTFHRTLRTAERSQYTKEIPAMQYGLSKLLSDKTFVQSVRDMGALDGVNSATSHLFCCPAINALLIDAEMDNPLIAPEERKKHAATNTLIAIIEEDSSHPLHPVLFPNKSEVPLDAAYIPPAPKNDGSGLATTANLTRWNETNLNLDEELLTVEIGMAAAIFKSIDIETDEGFGVVRRAVLFADQVISLFSNVVLKIISSDQFKQASHKTQFEKVFVSNLRQLKALANETLKELRFDDVSNATSGKHLILGILGDDLEWGLTKDEKYQFQQQQKTAFKIHNPKTNQTVTLNSNPKIVKQGFATDRGVTALKGLKLLHIPVDELTEQQRLDLSRGLRAQRTITKYRVPYFIAALELYNLNKVRQHLSREDLFYSIANTTSAILDLSVASLRSLELISKGLIPNWVQQDITLSKETLQVLERNTPKLAKFIGDSIPKLNLLSFVAGTITALMTLWEAFRLHQKQDTDAAIAMGVAGTGLLLTSFYAISPKATLGPIGWLMISVTMAALATAILLTDDDIEIWLKHGPFGHGSEAEKYTDLNNDPAFAWYHLINIMLNIQVKIEPLKQGTLPDQHYQYLKQTGIDTQITVNGNIQSLLSNDEHQANYHLELQEVEIKRQMSGGNIMGGHPVKTGRAFQGETLYSFKAEHGMIHYLRSTTEKSHLNAGQKVVADNYSEWQLRLKLQVNEFSFPAPEMHNGKAALDKISSQPDFSDSNPLGWLSDYEHGLVN